MPNPAHSTFARIDKTSSKVTSERLEPRPPGPQSQQQGTEGLRGVSSEVLEALQWLQETAPSAEADVDGLPQPPTFPQLGARRPSGTAHLAIHDGIQGHHELRDRIASQSTQLQPSLAGTVLTLSDLQGQSLPS